MRWEPLLHDELAETATTSIRDVALAIANEPDRAPAADRTIFWAYATNLIDDEIASPAYDAAIDELVEQLVAGLRHPALYGGLAGVGFTLAHVMDSAGDTLGVIDEALVRMLGVERWPGHHDLTQGLVGFGVYFLERLAQGDTPIARAGLERVIDHLEQSATETDAGIAWHSSPEILPSFYRDEWPHGFYDVGVAHGVPGTIALLARTAALTDPPPAARRLCDGAVRWVTAQRQSAHPRGRFPSRIAAGVPRDRSRAAWCYGDPGIAAALWRAAPELARETAHDCAVRDHATCGVRDAGLCHGAAGLAHLCNRFYQATGDAVHAAAARGWLERTLAMRHPGGFGGFVALQGATYGDTPSLRPVASLLEGSLGIALALAAAVTPTEPAWDRLLLCDLPVVERGA